MSTFAPAATGLVELIRSMADDELVIGWSDSEWTGIAPMLEEDVAMSSLAQDELGHAAALFELLAGLTGTDADTLALDRAPEDYRHCRLLDHGRGDWAMTIARRFLYDTADTVRLEALVDGSWPPLADLAGKLLREERYHRMHAGAWLDRLANDPREGRPRLLAAWQTLAPDAATVFAPLADEDDLVQAGILAAPMSSLESTWRATIGPVLRAVDIPEPPPMGDPDRARRDHAQPFAWLLGEMTMVRHAEPGAIW
jgi:ring-1,2-phenylacetyl-CoA epoxidase subunit PaaC